MSKKSKSFRQPKKDFGEVGDEPTEEQVLDKPKSPSPPPQRPLPQQVRVLSVKQYMLGRKDSLAQAFMHVEMLEQKNRIRKLPESEWNALYQKFLTTPRG